MTPSRPFELSFHTLSSFPIHFFDMQQKGLRSEVIFQTRSIVITVLGAIQSRDYAENNKYTWGLILDILISNQTRETQRGRKAFYYLLYINIYYKGCEAFSEFTTF